MLRSSVVLRRLSIGSFLAACLWFAVLPLHAGDNWQPITPEDLKMTSEQAGNAEAIILYHEYTSDDTRKSRSEYKRIKIFSEKAKRFADVEIPYSKEGLFSSQIIDVKARTIGPDGKITPFSGEVFDKTVVKTHGLKFKEKTFTLPDVQVGSIIEWRYTEIWSDQYVLSARWIIQENLAQKHAKFSYSPLDLSGSHYVQNEHGDTADGVYHIEVGLPKGVEIKSVPPRKMELDMTNIPAYEEEDFSPPAEMMKMRVYFYYGSSKMMKPEEFWKEQGKYWDKELDKFIGHSSSVAQAAEQAVSASDSPEQKVRKVYALVQKMKNFSYEGHDELETLAKLRKANTSAEQVLQQQAGTHDDLTRLFVAMVRSLRIPAYMMRIATREETFFQPAIPEWDQLNSEVAIVSLDGKEVFLDPGTRMCPYGLLEWKRTMVQGVRQKASGGTELSQTPLPEYSQAIVQRVADLKLNKEGSLKGQIMMQWMGQEALGMRIEGARTDEAGRKKQAEDELKALLPSTSVITLESATGWDQPDQPLRATFNVELPGLASSTGKRLLLPSGLFQINSRQRFVSANRKTPVYFEYPYRLLDKVLITLPQDVQVENLPQGQKANSEFAICYLERTANGNVLQFKRDFAIAGVSFPLNLYPALKTFFETVHRNDDEQVILRTAAVAASK
jgi:Domain of Unknown Function with PDB structure (DUF3857)/Transglutaminase-like superfamily